MVLGREEPCFIKEHSDFSSKYTEEDIIKILQFLVDPIFVLFGENVFFQQTVGIPMRTIYVRLLADIFLYSYQTEFIQFLLFTRQKQLASQFNFTYRYFEDVLSINNPDFEEHPSKMYLTELEIKDTTTSNTTLLPTLISSYRSGGAVNCILQFPYHLLSIRE